MDSWTDKQLALMKTGGNAKCADYLKAKGIAPGTAIKEKYESPAAQLYKEVLKARVEGRPEPTTLPTPAPRKNTDNRTMSSFSSSSSMGGGGGGAVGKPGEDPNGMERLTGETDQQYIQRQTRLKEQARARMQAKFGKSGGLGNSSMGGVGSSGPYQGGGGYGTGVDMDSVVAGFGSALGSLGSIAGSAVNTVSTSVSSVVQDENTRQSVANLAGTIKSTGGSFWNSLSTSVSTVAQAVNAPDQGDGLSELQQQFRSQRSATGSKYEGFGSDNSSSKNQGGFDFNSFGSSPAPAVSAAPSSNGGTASASVSAGGVPPGEAPGLPGEDRNGVAALTGESDAQYMVRQQRLRDEAKARMAAKFGSGGLSSASSGAAPTPVAATPVAALSPNGPVGEAPGLPGEDRNGIAALTGESDAQYMVRQQRIRDEAKARMAAKFGNGGLSSASSNGGMTASSTFSQSTPGSRNSSAPSSGNFGGTPATSMSAPSSGNVGKLAVPPKQKLNATKVKMDNSDDFFSNFGA